MADDPYAEFVKPAEAADPYAEFVKQPTALAAPPAVDPYAEFAPPTATAADPYAEFTGKPASVSGNGVPHGTIAPSENTNAEFNAAVQTVRASSGHHPVSPQEFQDEASTAQALLDYRRSRQLHGGAVGTQEFNLEQLAKEPAAPLNAVATFGAETVNQLAPAAATALGAIGGGIVGGVPGAIAGGIGAGKAMSKAQSELLGMIYTPDEQLRFQRNLEASTREHPQAAKMGGFLGQAPELFSGSTALKGIFTKFGMQAEKLPAKLLSNALTGGIMAGSNAAQQGGSVTDIAKEFTKGAVTMMPLAAIPGAKTILGNVLRGPADATVLATANAIYDKFASNKDIDPKQLFRDIISDIPGFVAANIVGHLAGQAHGMPIDETARRTAQLQASTIPAEQHAAILKLPKANQDAIIQAAQPIKLATSDDVEKVLADALKVQGDRAAIAAENFDQFNPTPDRTGEPPISAGAPTPTESAPNPAAPAPEAVKVPAQAATPPIETGAAPSSTPPPETKIAPVAPSTAGGETPLDRAALTKERKSIAKQQRDILNGKDVLSREDMAEYDRLTARDAELARQLTPDAEAKKSRGVPGEGDATPRAGLDQGAGDAKGVFALEQQTPEEVAAERARVAQADAIAKKQSAPLKGGRVDTTAALPGIGEENLFDKNRSAKPPDTSAKLGANESPANARSVKLPGKSEDRVERSYDGATDKHVYALVEKSGRRTEFDPAEHPDLAAHADRELGAKLDTKNGKAIADALLPGHDITAVGSMADVPAEVRGALPKNEQGGGAQGLYHSPTGRTFIIMDQIRDLRDLMETARHEAEGHGGVQAFLGDKFGAFMDGVVASKDKNKLLWSRIENSYGKENPRNTAGEYLAHLAERPQSDLSTWRRVVGFIRNHLRERFGLDVTDADVKYILQRAREETRAVKGEGTRAMLPLNGEDGKVNAEGKSNEQGLHLLGSTKRSDLLGASEQGREIRPKADTAIDDTSSRLRLEGSDAGAEAGDERAKDAAPELRSIFDNKHVPNAVVRAAVKLQNITKGLRHAVTNFAEKQDLAVTLDALGNAADEVNQGLSHDVHNALLRGIHGTADEKKVPRLSRSGLELPERHQENLALSHLVFSGNDLAALKTMRAKVADYLSRGAGDRPMSLAEKANWRRDGAKHLAALDFAIKHFDKMQDAAAMTRKVLDARNAEMNATGIDQRYHKNFFPKYSDLEGVEGTGVAIEGGGGSMGGGAHNEAMKYPTLVDAWAKGVSQKSVDGIQVLNRYLSDTSGKLAARKFVDVGKTMKAKDGRAIVGEMVMGDDIIKPAGKDANGKPKADDGFTLMRDRPGMQHAPGKLEPQTGYEEVTAGGQKIAMLPGFAKYFQHMEAPSAAETSGAAKGGLELAASAKSVMLVGDVFHAMRVAGYELATGNTVGYRRGEMLGKYSLPEAKRMLDNGEITQALYDYKIQNQHIHDALTRAGVNHVNFADNLRSELTRQVPWLSKLNRFIFDDLQVGAMNQVGVNEMRRVLKAKGVDPARATTAELADAAKFVGKDINTRFGNLGRQSVFRNHTFDDMMRFLFLAPRWNEGLIRSEFGAFVRQPLQLARDAVMGKKLIMPTLMKSQLTAIAGMFVANQLLNLATRGKPTWENEEAGHQWDAFIPTDASAPGLFISPMAISAEISHSMYNAFERTDSWIDAARQLATSRFSAVSKPLGVLILKRDALGRSLRPSEVLGETLRESIPAPISGSAVANLTKEGIGKLTGNDAGTRQTQPGEYLKRAISTMGIKTTTAPSAYQQMSKMAQDFNKARSVKEAPEYFIGPYQDLAKYLRIGNTTEARAALEDLRKEKTDTQIQKHFQGLPQTLFTHAGRAQEQAFIGTLTDKHRDLYRAAISEQRATAQKFFDLLRSTPAAPRVGLQHGQ